MFKIITERKHRPFQKPFRKPLGKQTLDPEVVAGVMKCYSLYKYFFQERYTL